MTKPNYTHIAVLLDRSGSMQSVQTDTIGGYNQFLAEQKLVPGDATVTLAQFNDKYEVTYADVPLTSVADLTQETYSPNGWTSLNDALAKLITDLGTKLATKPEYERPSKVVVVIMTDGHENTSKEFGGAYGLKKVNDMLTHQKIKYNWEFVFMGANIDAFSTAQSYGISSHASINYASTGIGTSNAFKSMSRGMTASRITASLGRTLGSFFENETNTNAVDSASLDTTSIAETIAKYTAEKKD